MDAALSGSVKCVDLLLQSLGIDIFKKTNSRGLTALHMACLGGNIEVLKRLFKEGLDIETCDNPEGLRPVHVAAMFGKLKVIEYLSTLDANLLAEDAEGLTAKEHAEAGNFNGCSMFL